MELQLNPNLHQAVFLLLFGLQRHPTWNGCSNYKDEVNLKYQSMVSLRGIRIKARKQATK